VLLGPGLCVTPGVLQLSFLVDVDLFSPGLGLIDLRLVCIIGVGEYG
jgi:hypothetical protein